MKTRIMIRARLWVELLMICLAAGAGTSALARGGGFHGGGFHGGGFHGSGFHGYAWSHGFYGPHRWGGFYIGPDWFWGPTVVVAGVPYYFYNGCYYTYDGDVLVAVDQSLVAPAPAPAAAVPSPATTPKVGSALAQKSDETITVNVPNNNGGFTPVKLVKTDKGYVGPQGELYTGHPTVDELKVLYGK
ncbi:MAG TPA: hypothetical protein VLX68_09640 [Chitinivibrionales bacterium]|nr:hypothetical protein [Chitinivibrionales bacterium]